MAENGFFGIQQSGGSAYAPMMAMPQSAAPYTQQASSFGSGALSGALQGTMAMGPGPGTAIGAGAGLLGDLITAGVNLWTANKTIKAQKEAQQKQLSYTNAVNAISQAQYAKEFKRSGEQWDKTFALSKDAQDWQKNQQRIGNLATWKTDLENKINSDVALKANLMNMWNQYRRAA